MGHFFEYTQGAFLYRTPYVYGTDMVRKSGPPIFAPYTGPALLLQESMRVQSPFLFDLL